MSNYRNTDTDTGFLIWVCIMVSIIASCIAAAIALTPTNTSKKETIGLVRQVVAAAEFLAGGNHNGSIAKILANDEAILENITPVNNITFVRAHGLNVYYTIGVNSQGGRSGVACVKVSTTSSAYSIRNHGCGS